MSEKYVILPITQQDSNTRSVKDLSVLLVSLFLAGCVTIPPDAFVVTPDLQQKRQIETRRYDGINEVDLVTASANVLQDLGFNLENSETKLGVITASKERDATQGMEIAATALASIFLFTPAAPVAAAYLIGSPAHSKDQTIRVALVVRPVIDSKGNSMTDNYFVRVTFQRIVRRTDNSIKAETLKDPQLYQDFFERLSKSVFLEAQKI